MAPDTIILGSGTMAREIGAYLLGRGISVTWVSGDGARRDELTALAQRTIRRARRADEALARDLQARVCSVEQLPAQPARCVIETTNEDLARKRAAIAAVDRSIGPDTLLLSNSSSLLPADIDPRCTGMHFFAPVMLTGIVEIVLERGRPGQLRDDAAAFAARVGLDIVHQDERNAFAANRLLLPMQLLCAQLLRRGVPAKLVEESSTVAGMSTGQLALMDRVGIATIATAVRNYRSRMEREEAERYEELSRMLDEVRAAGKGGSRQGDGLLCGGPLPWAVTAAGPDAGSIRQQMQRALQEGASQLEREGLARDDIERLMRHALGLSA